MLGPVLLTAAVLLVSYLYSRLRYLRFKQYAHIPQLPSNLLLGHLKTFGEFMQRGIVDRHPGMKLTKDHYTCVADFSDIQVDRIFEEMWLALGRPPVMLVDLRPINPPLLLVPSHEIAEQVSKPTKLYPMSTTKSPTWTHMTHIIGKTSILGREVSRQRLGS